MTHPVVDPYMCPPSEGSGRDNVADLWSRFTESYPGGFADPTFQRERQQRVKLVELARSELDEGKLRTLLEQGEFAAILKRFRKVGEAADGLLYVRPQQDDDLTLLRAENNPDLAGLCQRLVDLVQGPGSSAERLGRFTQYVERARLRNAWPLPTALLMLKAPIENIVVRPREWRHFIELVSPELKLDQFPSRPGYEEVLRIVGIVKDGLAAHHPVDNLDVQAFAHAVTRQPASTRVVRGGAAYDVETLCRDTGFDQPLIERWLRNIRSRKQAILMGPPGTGKTFVAERLARVLTEAEKGHTGIIQFHPAYEYEDFMEGLRPVEKNGTLVWERRPGTFLRFCEDAREVDGPAVLIIDEINRADLSRVFGELMYLLENREKQLRLSSGEPFSIPENVIILGTMNTADRSIALMDHALRRRFVFLDVPPSMDILRRYHKREKTGFDVEPLVKVLAEVNDAIRDRHYHLGVSFFLRPDIGEQLEDVWEMQIYPYLDELFFDRPDEVERFRWQVVKRALQSPTGSPLSPELDDGAEDGDDA